MFEVSGQYEGEVNSRGKAHGVGTFTSENSTFTGHFFNNRACGYCYNVNKQKTDKKELTCGETKNNQWSGNQTFYDSKGNIFNRVFAKKRIQYSIKINNAKEAFFDQIEPK